jgi:hypothetical protein
MVKEFSWVPDIKEFILYIITIILVVLLIRLFHHNKVQQVVKQTSRCLREQSIGQKGGVYTVSAYNQENNPMYKVSYNFKEKSSSLDCACKKGTIANTFSVPMFNIRDPKAGDTNIDQVCLCDQKFDDTMRTYYSGYPGLVRYMYSQDKAFFYTALDPKKSS